MVNLYIVFNGKKNGVNQFKVKVQAKSHNQVHNEAKLKSIFTSVSDFSGA